MNPKKCERSKKAMPRRFTKANVINLCRCFVNKAV